MTVWSWRLIVTLLLLSSLAHGEGRCPAGMIPASGTNTNSCVPISAGYYRQLAAPAPPPIIWADRWGAVATDSVKGVLGVATDMVSKDEAERVALFNCAANGGTQYVRQPWYGNGCAVMVLGDTGWKRHSAKAGPTIDGTTRAAMGFYSAADVVALYITQPAVSLCKSGSSPPQGKTKGTV